MSPFIIPVVAVALLLFRTTPEPDRAILLPDADGKVGRIVVRSASGQQELDTAYAAREIDRQGNIVVRSEDAASVRARYGALLDARPPMPQSWMLYFVSGSAQTLTPESQSQLDQIKAAIARYPAPEISVIGHTDRVGSQEANDVLSRQRAEAIGSLLQASGIEAQMTFSGRGEREPLVPTADEVAEPANRRVEINLR